MELLRDVGIRHLVTVQPEASLRKAAQAMNDRNVGCSVVMENEKVAGIITERDVLRAIADAKDFDSTTVSDVMTPNVVTGTPAWDVVKAVRTMVEGGFRHLLICELDDPIGIVSLRDLMDSMANLVQVEEPSA